MKNGELGRWGTEMARRNGWSPARLGVARGYRVISGLPPLSELASAEREAVLRDLQPWPVWVERTDDRPPRTTPMPHCEGTRPNVGSIVQNDGEIDELAAVLVRAL
jgi:hypothetical protein